MEFNNELTQRTGVVGAGDEGTTSRPSDGGHSIYVTASSTKMDTVVFMHKWSISQFSVQQELSNAGEFLESKFVSIIYLGQLIARLSITIPAIYVFNYKHFTNFLFFFQLIATSIVVDLLAIGRYSPGLCVQKRAEGEYNGLFRCSILDANNFNKSI